MKKLMMAMAVVLTAVAVQAAGYSWKSGMSGGVLFTTDNTQLYTAVGAATLYLFNAADLSQADLVAGFAGGKSIASDYSGKAVKTAALTTGSKITTTAITTEIASGTYDFFFATEYSYKDTKYLYVSSLKEDLAYAGTGSTSIQFTDLANSKTGLDAASGFTAGGTYSSVPEPTSGLLLLLGMAGLALKRKNA